LLWDVRPEITEKGIKKIEKRLNKSLEKGKIDAETVNNVMSRIVSAELEQMSSAEIIIEAVVEDFVVKTELYLKLEQLVQETTIIGTNTSSLSVMKLSDNLQKPERFLGIHFFNPPTKLELVELILTGKTTSNNINKIKENLTACGKTTVEVKDSPGFIANRLLIPMINEAAKLLDEKVAKVEDIDTAMCLGALHPVGPLQLADLIGLDVCKKILDILAENLNNPSFKPAKALVERVESGRLGRKTNAGFYEY